MLSAPNDHTLLPSGRRRAIRAVRRRIAWLSVLATVAATLLVAGIREFTYPAPDGGDERISFAPQQFRYEVSLVRADGVWKADDLDDVDDSLPSFSDAADPESSVPNPAPTEGAPGGPSNGATTDPSGKPAQPGQGESGDQR